MPECAPAPTNPPSQCGRGVSAEAIDVGFADMTTFARILSRLPAVGRPVVDRTELTGGYKVN
ncbi:MAG: DUF3738 domain-containing protein, partial [Vicinamibacterales bacterium]